MNTHDDKLLGPDLSPARVPPEPKPISFRVVRGAMSSILRKIIVAPISLLLVPFTLYKIGVAGYGTWAILATIINLTWLMDPGLSPTVTKYVAEHSGTNDLPEIRRVLDASAALCLFLSAVAALTLWLFSHVIIREFFRGPGAPPAAEIQSLWPWVTLCIVAFLLTTPFIAVINGKQRMDLANVLIFSAELFSASATVAFLCAGAKVRGLLQAQLLTSVFTLVGAIAIVHRLLPSVTPNPFRFKFRALWKIVAFSVPLYAGSIMTSIQGQLEKLYLARFVGVVPVGWYNVANEGAAKVKRVPDLLLGPMLAAASELDATKERGKMEELHFRAHKYFAFIAVPLVIFAVVAARLLIRLWVGNSLAMISVPFALLVIGNFFPQMGTPVYFILVGRGILRPAVYTAILAALLNIILSYFFIKHWGFSGAVLGTAIPMFLSTLCMFALSDKYFRIPLYGVVRRAYLKPLLCASVAAFVIPAIGLLKLHGWQSLVADGIAYASIYLIGLAMTHFFDSFDISQAESHLPILRLARRVISFS